MRAVKLIPALGQRQHEGCGQLLLQGAV